MIKQASCPPSLGAQGVLKQGVGHHQRTDLEDLWNLGWKWSTDLQFWGRNGELG